MKLMVVGLGVSMVWATVASAQTDVYSLTGSGRAQIGNGLPLPITFAAPPEGAVKFTGTILQTTGPDPKEIQIPSLANAFGPVTLNIGVFGANSAVFQVQTSLIVTGPIAPVVFKAGGRSNIATFTWCPGLPLPTASFNPGCTNPLAGGSILTQASIRYEKTVAQFGGVSQTFVAGAGASGTGAVVAIRVPGNAGAPCDFTITPTCIAAFSNVIVQPTGVGGGPIGNAQFSPSPAPAKIYQIKAPSTGIILLGSITSVGAYVGPFPPNTVKTYGGPWTTGKVTVKAPNGGETFYMQGSDGRVNGVGTLNLVSGGVSSRSLSGDNANRGWQTYNISFPVLPAISNMGLVLLAVILAGMTTLMIRRATTTVS